MGIGRQRNNYLQTNICNDCKLIPNLDWVENGDSNALQSQARWLSYKRSIQIWMLHKCKACWKWKFLNQFTNVNNYIKQVCNPSKQMQSICVCKCIYKGMSRKIPEVTIGIPNEITTCQTKDHSKAREWKTVKKCWNWNFSTLNRVQERFISDLG